MSVVLCQGTASVACLKIAVKMCGVTFSHKKDCEVRVNPRKNICQMIKCELVCVVVGIDIGSES